MFVAFVTVIFMIFEPLNIPLTKYIHIITMITHSIWVGLMVNGTYVPRHGAENLITMTPRKKVGVKTT